LAEGSHAQLYKQSLQGDQPTRLSSPLNMPLLLLPLLLLVLLVLLRYTSSC
jgi:hypothetical protein